MERVDVNPELLRWARVRAGLDMQALTSRFPKLESWEMGEASPTLKQLESFARATFVPIGFFFLPAPPVEQVPIPDFRTLSDAPVRRVSPGLLDTVYLCQQRQDWFREYVRWMQEPPRTFVGAARVGDDIVATAGSMRAALGFDFDERRRVTTWEDALRLFIAQADKLGVLVMVSGVVGSNNRRKLNPEEFRGFALADAYAPHVFVNGSDTKAAQMFTLAHELAHIWLGQSAISDTTAADVPDHRVEGWCNEVAAELLVPLEAIRHEYNPNGNVQEEASRLARRYKVSTLVVLRRIHDAHFLSTANFWAAYRQELARLLALPKGAGGDFYRSLGARASKTFARALVVSTMEGRTSFTEAFRLLGFKKMSTFRELGNSLGVAI